MVVERKVTYAFHDLLALVLEGWIEDDTQYFAMGSTFRAFHSGGYQKALFAFSKMGDKSRFDDAQHLEFTIYTLELFKKSLANVAEIIGEKCNTNKYFGKRRKIIRRICISHIKRCI